MGSRAIKYLIDDDLVEKLRVLQENIEEEVLSYEAAALSLKWVIEDIEREAVDDD